MDEAKRQSDKEEAVLLALQYDVALIRRGLEIHSLHKDGSTTLISKSNNYEQLWTDALAELKERYKGDQ